MDNTVSVRTGFWINHAYGDIRGATLTLSISSGAYLIAFLAVFVQLTGTFVWSVLSYTLFMLRSRERANGLHHQQQTIFRNASSPVKAIGYLFWTWRAWRHNSGVKRTRWSSLAFAILAIANTVGFIVAGILSSRVAQPVSEVLLEPGFCGDFSVDGWFGYSKNTSALSDAQYAELYFAADRFFQQEVAPGAAYYEACQRSSSQVQPCNPINRRAVYFTTDVSSNCPFGDENICAGQTLKFDTGMLDSLLDYGINTPFEDRIAVRWVVDCAPLKSTKQYATGWLPENNSLIKSLYPDQQPGYRTALFYYGWDDSSNITKVLWSNTNSVIVAQADSGGTSGTSNFPVSSTSEAEEGFWPLPIRPFTKLDTYYSIYYIINNGIFQMPVNDPWFSAHHTVTVDGQIWGLKANVTAYMKDDPVAIGCSERSQYCNVAAGNCTDLVDIWYPQWDSVLKSKRQRTLALRISQRPSLPRAVQSLSRSGMLADGYCDANFCAKLPDNQWQLEMERYFGSTVFANQYYSSMYVTGTSDPLTRRYWASPTPEDEWMCHNQIVVREDYVSFSVLGVFLIIAFGGCVILVRLMLALLGKGGPLPRSGPRREWQMMSLFQQQRLALAGAGDTAVWEKVDDLVPVTAESKELGRFSADADSSATVEHSSVKLLSSY